MVNGLFRLNLVSKNTTKINQVITDILGRTLLLRPESLISGFNTVEMNVVNLPAGAYTICGFIAG